MRTEAYVLEQLLGMQPWRVPGSTEFRPSLLERLSFSRPEGYETVDQLPLDGASANWLFPQGTDRFTEMIGADSRGSATFTKADGDLALTRKKAIEGIVTPISLGANTSPAHIDGFGAYASSKYFIGETTDDEVFGPQGQENQLAPVIETGQIGSDGEDSSSIGGGTGDIPARAEAATFHTGTDEWLAAVNTQVFHTDNINEWNETAWTIPSGTWQDMHSDGSTILIVGNGGKLLRSTNATSPSFTEVAGPHPWGSRDLMTVMWGDGTWVIGGKASSGDKMWYSSDGLSWTAASVTIKGFSSVQETVLLAASGVEDIDYSSTLGSWACTFSVDGGTSVKNMAGFSLDGVNWDARVVGNGYWKGIAIAGQLGHASMVSSIVPGTLNWDRGAAAVSYDGGTNWSYLGAFPDGGNMYDLAWDGEKFWAVGEKGSDGAVYSADTGDDYEVSSGLYDLAGMPLRSIVVGPDGTVVAWARTSGSHPGYVVLKRGSTGGGVAPDGPFLPGDYEAIWLGTVDTDAGKTVIATGRRQWAFLNGSRGIVSAWSDAAPTELDGTLRYEIYIRYAPEEYDEATEQYRRGSLEGRDFILAKVLDAGDGSSSSPIPISYPEIGRVLPDVGSVGISALDGYAAFWNDRIWFAPSGDASEYRFVKGEPRMSSLERSMTVAFTELEYLNLTSESAYLHLPQGSSSKITGIIGTPSGLMVFGENNAYLISGDPAIEGSLQVENFPSAIGCDDGVRPTSLAGVVFTIWRGRLYAIDGANATDVSRGVLDGEVAVRDIAPDVSTNSIAVMTDEAVLHFDLDVGEWYLSERLDKAGTAHVFGAGSGLIADLSGLYVFSFEDVNGTPTGFITTYATSGDPYDQPGVIEWRGVDAGNAYRADYWRYVRLPVDVEQGEFNLAAGSVPYLYWRARQSQPDVADEDPTYRVTGMLREGELIFKLPYGHLSRRIDVRVVIPMDQRMAIQPGVSFGYSPGPLGDNLPPA